MSESARSSVFSFAENTRPSGSMRCFNDGAVYSEDICTMIYSSCLCAFRIFLKIFVFAFNVCFIAGSWLLCHWYAEFFGMIFIKEDTMFYGIPYVKSHLENSFVYFL